MVTLKIFSIVSATIDCAISEFLPPIDELEGFIGNETNFVTKDGKLCFSGSWESIASIHATLTEFIVEKEKKDNDLINNPDFFKKIEEERIELESILNHENEEESDEEEEDCLNIEVFHSESRGGEISNKKNSKFSCSLCSFQSQRESHFLKHTALHQTMKTIYHCDECSFSTLRFTHLRRHQVAHSLKTLTCSTCDYSTDDTKLLARHNRLKHKVVSAGNEEAAGGETVRQCPACSYTTSRLHLYERHMKVHSAEESKGGPNLFICSQCDYRTSRKMHYVRHVRDVHRQWRPYLCHNCGKAFKRPDALKQHSLLHSTPGANSAFQCRVCAKICHSRAHLKGIRLEHQAVHSSERSFLCEICGASFKTRSVQRKHVATLHQNPRAYPCELCTKRFNTNYALRRHMKQHPTTIEVDELENNMSSKLVTIVLPNDNQSVSEEALTLTVKLDHEETSLLSTL